jgi:phosphoglycerol transferase MdoB-like AlkP superfamily enzyme
LPVDYLIAMHFIQKIPRPLRWIISVGALLLLTMMLFRLIFFFAYKPAGMPFSGSAFVMGLRFDIKFVSIAALCMLLLSILPFFNPYKYALTAKVWQIVLTVIFTILLLFYFVDYFYYDYLQQRLSASILSFAKDARISGAMAWQTYPVIRSSIVVLILATMAWFAFKKLFALHYTPIGIRSKKRSLYYIFFFLLFALGVFGKIGQFNLRWSDAFTLNNTFKANVALNPLQSFFSSLGYTDLQPDAANARKYYNYMASVLGVQHPDSSTLHYDRSYNYPPPPNPPNIVIVIGESFAMHKSSMSGNPLNATPFFNSLCNSGIFFTQCFSPAYSTARGVWATMTGLPDVLLDNKRTASRNPEVVNQRLIMNEFDGYEKFYFIGGDPTWANIKGMLMNNIDNLHLYSQDSFKAKKLDVWGIDDKNLFLEASQILARQQKPFIAVIQTADNHRPYSIPEADLGEFKKITLPEDTLIKYGYFDNDELNAFRYTDFTFQKFIEAAKKEKYFNNTIFVFTGDHGTNGNSDALYPVSWREKDLISHHVPLLFYAPALLQPHRFTEVCSQTDIMPSVACLAQIPHRNTALGKNLFDSSFRKKDYAFLIDHEGKNIGIVNSNYYYILNLKTNKTELVPVGPNTQLPTGAAADTIKNAMDLFTQAYYQTAWYMLYNNGRQKQDSKP